jgi:lipopolysaccharide export system protein LptA
MKHLATSTLLLGVLWTGLVPAGSQDTRQPITIEADRAELDERRGISTYTGNVQLTQGGIQMHAHTLTVYTLEGQLQRIVAEGDPVRYRQQRVDEPDVHGNSQRINYDAATRRLLLLDRAELLQGNNRFSGERIQYDPDAEQVIASGAEKTGQRVTVTLQPKPKPAPQDDP